MPPNRGQKWVGSGKSGWGQVAFKWVGSGRISGWGQVAFCTNYLSSRMSTRSSRRAARLGRIFDQSGLTATGLGWEHAVWLARYASTSGMDGIT